MITGRSARLLGLLALAAPCVATAQSGVLTLLVGTPVPLVTVDALSSKTSVKGDMVRLRTVEDVVVDGAVAIPRGTEATAQVIDARAKGAMGMSGQLLIRPLYLRIGDKVVRLAGQVSDKASVTAGAVIGTVALRLPAFTGRSAVIPAGTRFDGVVERTVDLQRRP